MKKDLQHDLICDVKRVADDLGRLPKRDEYLLYGKFSRRQVVNAFGSYGFLIGSIKQEGKSKIKSLFHESVKSQVQGFDAKKKLVVPDNMQKIVHVSDTHYPFVCKNTTTYFMQYIDQFKPDILVHTGDLHDMFSHSRFPRSRNFYNPREEIELAYKMADDFFKTVRKMFPKIKIYLLLGNHDVRPLKKILKQYPEGEIFFSIDKYFTFDGVHTLTDPRAHLDLCGIRFIHGYKTRLGDHARFHMTNTAVGHSHKGGVLFIAMEDKIIFECNAGMLGDPYSKNMEYTPNRITGYTKGFASYDEFGPRFVAAP